MSQQQSAAVSGRLLLNIASRQQLRSALHCLLSVPRHRRSTLGRRAFSVAGPSKSVCNLLPDQLRDSGCTESTFRHFLYPLLAFLLAQPIMRYTNLHFTCYFHWYRQSNVSDKIKHAQIIQNVLNTNNCPRLDETQNRKIIPYYKTVGFYDEGPSLR